MDELKTCRDYSKRFQMLISGLVLFILVVGIVIFSLIVELFIYKHLLDQTYKDNTTIGESILELVDKAENRPEDEKEYIELLQHTCDVLKLPNNGYVCAIDSTGLLVAAPGLKSGKKVYLTSADFVSKDRKETVGVKDFFKSKKFNGFYEYPEHSYSDILVGVDLENAGLKLLVHQDNNKIKMLAKNKTNFIRIVGLALALVISVIIYLILNKKICEYQVQINAQNEELADAIEKIRAQNNQLTGLLKENQALMGIMAHDLRSPLNNIRSLNDMIQRVGELSAEQKEFIEYSQSAINSGLVLISDILSLSRLEQQNNKLELAEIDINHFVQTHLLMHQSKADEKNIDFTVENKLTSKNALVTEEKSLVRVLDNLISNAIKFTFSGKKVVVELTDNDEELIFKIIDQGQGFRDEDLPKLYGKFEKLASRPTGGESSTGLGLYIVKLLCDKLACTINLETKWGEGSTFIIKHPKNISSV
ncbi:HAMP domain-containing histidine kinase [Prolixibacteraceae bacterium JC049]|nr:HAMP domain-containing histidine kinase [Prolixibacteraceae bacterium JC049]